MSLERYDRVKQTTSTTGTGSYSLNGTVDGFDTFSSRLSTGSVVEYCCTDGTDYEVGEGTFASGGLSRDTILQSSNGDAAVNWGSGDKDIFITLPASRLYTTDTTVTVNLDEDAIAAVFRAYASQTANIAEWQDSGGAALVVIDKDGNVGIGADNLTNELQIERSGMCSVKVKSDTDTITFTIERGATNKYAAHSFMTNGSFRWSIGMDNDGTDNFYIGDNLFATKKYLKFDRSTTNIALPNDNSKLFFGAGEDASIYYDGSDLIINTQEVGSGNLVLNGDLVLNSYTDATRPSPGVAGRIIWNTDDGIPNFDNGTNWVLADGTTT